MGLYTDEIRIVCIFICCVLFIIGMSGNSLIIWTFLKTKRLRIVQNVFVVLLAIVDLHIIGLLIPFTFSVLISNSAPNSKHICKVFGAAAHMLFTLCLQLIMCIAISRYVKICHGKLFPSLFTPRKTTGMALLCVIYWFAFFVPLLIDDYIIFDAGLQMCNFDRFKNVTYTNVYIFFCLVLPVFVTSMCYIKLYMYIRKSKFKLYRNWNNGLARQRIMHELTITRCQFAVFVVYLILYMPFGISTIVGKNPSSSLAWITPTAFYCGLLNSCINSILYGVMNSNIRNAYFEVVPCFRRRNLVRVKPVLKQVQSECKMSSLETEV